MNYIAHKEYTNPYRLSGEGFDAFSYLGITNDGESEEEPGDAIPYSEGLISSLRKRYMFRDEPAVTDFLVERPLLIQLLFKAHKVIRSIFGTAPGLTLKVIADPEALEEQELFLFIQTKLHPRAARPLLDEISREWWLSAMLDARGEMNISL